MGYWEGMIFAGHLQMMAKITYTPPTDVSYGRWRGSGRSAERWPWGETIETTVGPILILNPISVRDGTGLYHYVFWGDGKPNGLLAETMRLGDRDVQV